MQKKVLLSLLATAPVAFSVSAHQNVTLDTLLEVKENNDEWKFTGVPTLDYSVANQVTVGQPGTSCYMELDKVWSEQKGYEMPVGLYKIQFDVLETAIIKINGEEFTNGSEYNYQGGAFKIEIINSVNAHSFKFGQGHLELRYNFEQEQADLNAQVAALKLKVGTLNEQNPENPDNVSPVYQALIAERENIMANIADVETVIGKINLPATDPIPDGKTAEQYYLDIYREYHLDANPNDIQATINSLDKTITEFNEKATAENERYNRQETNWDNYVTVNERFKEFTDWKDAFKFEDAPEYVQDKCQNKWDELESEKNEVSEMITATFFTDGKIKDDAIVNYDALTTAIEELNGLKTTFLTEFDKATADFNAYNTWYTQNVSLDKYREDILAALQEIADKDENKYGEEEEKVYQDLVNNAKGTEEKKGDLQILIDNAREQFTIKDAEIEGAADKLAQNLALIDGAKSDMDDYKTAFENTVSTQEDAFDTANTAWEAANTALAAAEKLIVDDEMSGETDAKAEVTRIRGLIDAQKAKIDEEYLKHDLTADDYNFTDITTAIEKLKTDIATDKANKVITDANNAWVSDLETEFAKLTGEINVAFPVDSDLGGIFDTTTKNIKNSIDAFNTLVQGYNERHELIQPTTDYQQYVDIKQNIEDTKALVQPLKKAYDACDVSLDAMQGVVDGMETSFTNKKQVRDGEGNVIGQEKTDEWIEPFKSELKGYNDDLDEITNGLKADPPTLTPKEAYDQVMNLGKDYEVKKTDFKKRANEATVDFNQKYSKSNYKVVNGYYLSVSNAFQALGAEDYPGKTDAQAALDDIRENLDEISKIIYGNGTFSDPSTDQSELNTADEGCQGAYNSLFDADSQIKALKANNEAYAAITTALNNAKAALEEAITDVTNKTTEPARTFFLDQLSALETRLTGEEGVEEGGEKSVEAAAKEDYNAIKSAEKKDDTIAEIDRIYNETNNVVNNALMNDAAHVTQLNAMKDLLEDLDGFRTEINNYDQIPSDRNKYIEKLDSVVAKYDNLVNTIAEAFAVGTSYINNEDIMANIDSIRAEGQAIVDEMKGNYNQAVKDYNAGVVAKSDWDEWQTTLNQEYRKSVDTYNEYHNSLQNAGFREYMGDVITTHEGIYAYSTPIRALIDEVNELIKTEFNDKSEILTPEWIEENAIAPAEKIYNDMKGEVTVMTTTANEKAEEYYQMQLADATAIVKSAYDVMIQAGVSEENAKAATEAVDKEIGNAIRYHEIGTNNGNLCLLMGAVYTEDGKTVGKIADIFDAIGSDDIDMNAAALAQWTDDYTAAKEEIEKCISDVAGYKDISETDAYSRYSTRLNEINEAAEALNTEATSPEMDNLIGNLPDLQSRLEELLNEAKNIDATAKDENDEAVAEKTAYEEFNAQLDGVAGTDFDNLKAWAEGMAVEYLQDYSEIDAAIANAKKYLEDNRGNLTEPNVNATAEGMINNVKMLIEEGYAKCYSDETNALTELDNEARRQYNEEFAGTDLTTGDALKYGNLLNDIEAEIAELSATIGATSDLDEVKTTLLDLQSRLVSIIDEICAIREVDSPAVGILNDLNTRYNEVSEQIAGLFEGIEEEVKAEFNDKATGLSTDLDAVKAAYEAEDSKNLIAVGNNYDKDMDDISDAATALRTEIETANTEYIEEQARHQASDARAAELQTELDGLDTDFRELDAFVKGAGCYQTDEAQSQYAIAAEELQQMLTDMQTWLTAQKEAYGLTADSTLEGADEFNTKLKQEETLWSYQESDFQYKRAQSSVDAAELAVRSAQHFDQAALETALADLKARFSALNRWYGNMEDTKALTATVDDIVADAEALKSEAEATVFILGDVNGNGRVDAADLQALINIISTEDVDAEDARFMTLNINNDEAINIADVVSLANMIFNQAPEDVMMRLKSVRDNAPIVNIQAVETASQGGTRTIQINLTNTVAFAGGQFDLKLPAGMSIISESLSERSEGMGMVTNDFADGRHRVVLFSSSLEEMDGTEGAVLELEVSGTGNIYVENAVFSDRFGHAYEGTDPGTTGIDGIINGAIDGTKKVYDAAGRMVNKLQKGINIIVNGNGKGKKVMNRK